MAEVPVLVSINARAVQVTLAHSVKLSMIQFHALERVQQIHKFVLVKVLAQLLTLVHVQRDTLVVLVKTLLASILDLVTLQCAVVVVLATALTSVFAELATLVPLANCSTASIFHRITVL